MVFILVANSSHHAQETSSTGTKSTFTENDFSIPDPILTKNTKNTENREENLFKTRLTNENPVVINHDE